MQDIQIDIEIQAHVRVRFLPPLPSAPTVLGVTFTRGTSSMGLLGTLTFLAPAAPGVTRDAQITLNGAAPIVVDVTNPTATFSCNVGDTYSITATDTNATGVGPISAVVLTGIASVTGGTVPGDPGLLSVSFVPA